MPADFRELGPSYRAANPEGVRQWIELEHKAITGNRLGQKPANEVTWARLQNCRCLRFCSPGTPISIHRPL